MAASNTADLFYQLFRTFTGLAILVAVAVFALMAYLLVHYRDRPSASEPDDAPRLGKMPGARGHLRTAIISISLSSIILGVLIFGTISVTDQITQIPSQCDLHKGNPGQCIYIQVSAYRFGWNFTYPNGKTVNHDLTLPTGRIVVLVIKSVDDTLGNAVFHSFKIDDFRIGKDAIPGLTNKIWFIANDEAAYVIRCFEYCGSGHARMLGKASVSNSAFQNVCSGSGC